uniref:RING-type E3 ubiquitin transferase n=1 Tax=Timspurckia oligopyrenoides TaxID=708627 RepID=A0A7S1ETP9_9RHOD|mmetsp:Transcript_7996/g.14506  ORF Transcript_7996/g.14506 Transcript_7996/m.14506 type:complete len:148 (+) Transcript_7996:193-636(+)|eukprot:CAMPEP_0182441952 /NCGR_PEP_ID=MMETSP1172-20130603/929_1 /TAXON_ID=708627 /ORGANISM="Timspurckia oligopyrenoides, Strain CCMP3278" /LENGTH=147 /DNA_ID=CAMNT_0024636567 /DNA_START=174 /DNA_END=617 /DNA_ORIENTATION=-
MGQCCGTDSRSESDEQYSRTDRRPGSSTHSSTYDPKSMPKQHIGFEEGTPSPPLPPPLVPDSKAVYDLLEGEHEEVCPTCLEEYTNENPRMTSMCQHTFHLACIYEWLERSPYCPICAKKMMFADGSEMVEGKLPVEERMTGDVSSV